MYDQGIGFGREGNHLVADDDGGGGEVTARLARTGEAVRLRLPAGYDDRIAFFGMTQWLVDDRIVVSADMGDLGPSTDSNDLLVCRLSSGRCQVAVSGTPLTGFGGRG